MPITDLTNTTWVFNNSIMTRSSGYYNINFTSNNSTYTNINWTYLDDDDFFALYYGSTNVYTNSGGDYWNNNAYKTIKITGGTDATNATLISWLETNATQQAEPTFENKITLGNLAIDNMSVGNTDVAGAYLGETKIYEKL